MRATQVLLKRSTWKGQFNSPQFLKHQLTHSRAKPRAVRATSQRQRPPFEPRLTLNSLPIQWPKTQGEKVPPVRTNARSATILPSFVGLRFEVHNGKIYNSVKITEDMVGHKLGEFSQYVVFLQCFVLWARCNTDAFAEHEGVSRRGSGGGHEVYFNCINIVSLLGLGVFRNAIKQVSLQAIFCRDIYINLQRLK